MRVKSPKENEVKEPKEGNTSIFESEYEKQDLKIQMKSHIRDIENQRQEAENYEYDNPEESTEVMLKKENIHNFLDSVYNEVSGVCLSDKSKEA